MRLKHLVTPFLLSALVGLTANAADVTSESDQAHEDIGPWKLICDEGGEKCVARQTISLDKGSPDLTLDLFMTSGPQGVGTLSVVTSLDVLIGPGVGIARSDKTVSAPVWHGDFVACGTAGCQANGFLDPDSLYGADDPVAVFVSPDGKTIAIPVSISRIRDVIERVRG